MKYVTLTNLLPIGSYVSKLAFLGRYLKGIFFIRNVLQYIQNNFLVQVALSISEIVFDRVIYFRFVITEFSFSWI